MLRIRVTNAIGNLTKNMSDRAKRQIPFATKEALNTTILDVRGQALKRMPSVFNQPRMKYWGSKNAVGLNFAVKKKDQVRLKASMEFIGGRKNNAERVIEPHVYGGQRSEKRFESRLRSAGKLRSGNYLINANEFRGKVAGKSNLSGSKITTILSDIRAQFDPKQNRLTPKQAKASGKKFKKGRYFYGEINRTRGVWLRHGSKKDNKIKPVMIEVGQAVYKKRYPFYTIALGVTKRRFPMNFARAFSKAMKTAR